MNNISTGGPSLARLSATLFAELRISSPFHIVRVAKVFRIRLHNGIKVHGTASLDLSEFQMMEGIPFYYDF